MKLVFRTFLLFVSVAIVSGVGLNEDFTWTRINFDWNSIDASMDSSSGSSHGGDESRPQDDSIIFDQKLKGFSSGTQGHSITTQFNQNSNNKNNENRRDEWGSIDYKYAYNIPMGFNVWKDRLFISIPRKRFGVPSTLNYVPLNSHERHNVPLRPYPNWKINLYPDPSGRNENLISVYRFAIDPCDRMWLVDTGIIEGPGNRTHIRRQHQIVVINLREDQIIHRYDLPDRVVTPLTTLSSLTVDVTENNCDDAFVYLPDHDAFGVIVYSLRENRAWRVTHNYFYLESINGEFSIAGHRFQWNDGVFSIELSNIKHDGYRDMYFHSLAGTHQFKVSTKVMRNEKLATRRYHGNDFEILGDRGPLTQASTAEIHQPTGIMFLGLINKNALGCWNINKPLRTLSIVQRDDNKMIFPSDVKIVDNKVYVLTTTYPGFVYGRLDYDQINFRVWSNDIGDAVQGAMGQNGFGDVGNHYQNPSDMGK